VSQVSGFRRAAVRAYYRTLNVLCPGLRNSQFAYREMLLGLLQPDTRWLDLGCGHQLLPEWMPDSVAAQKELEQKCAAVVGIDVDLRPHAIGLPKVAGDIHQLPFPDGSFSLVTANMVVEHVSFPERLLEEVRRVLAPGGLFAFHTPNAHYFEVMVARHLPPFLKRRVASLLDGRPSDDVFTTHYRLNTISVIRRTAERCGLEPASIRPVECTAQAIMLGPLVIPELLVIRALRLKIFAEWRSDLLVILRKPHSAGNVPNL